MSNPWAIAAVTAVMRHTLWQQLDSAATGGIIRNSEVTALSPDRLAIGSDQPSRLNLFLYEITNDPAFRNDPSALHRGDRTPMNCPPMSLRLRYLLSACGTADYENEILLAHGLEAFRKSPIFSRQVIRTILDPALPDGPGIPPRVFREQAMPVAEPFEPLKVISVFLPFDEMSKIWASLQSVYRPSLVFEVTSVIV